MNNNTSKTVLEQVNNFIESKFGLYFQEERFKDLMRGLSNSSKQKGIDVEKYISLILLNKLSEQEIMNLATFLTIGETYFFRDKKIFEAMRHKILPDIINERKYTSKKLKVWSAGCSTGEEAYSIAILIKELITDYENWDIKIIATDINQNSLNKAKKAIYSEWSFRGVDLNIKNKYFDNVDGIYYKLKDNIAGLIKFNILNLADPSYILDNEVINDVDIIFCRNVLMYFSKHKAHAIISRFYNTIVDKGWLVGTPSESLYFNDTSFVPVNTEGAFLYKKDIKKNDLVKKIDSYITVANSLTLSETITFHPKLELYQDIRVKKVPVFPLINKNINEKRELQEEIIDMKELENIARSFANEGKLDDALKWCEKAISRDKINPVFYHLLANIQQEQGEINEAIASLKKAIFLKSDFIMAYFDLGNLNLKQERFKEASKNFENVQVLLNNYSEEDTIPYSEEMTVGMLRQIIENLVHKGDLYEKM